MCSEVVSLQNTEVELIDCNASDFLRLPKKQDITAESTLLSTSSAALPCKSQSRPKIAR